MRVRVTAPGKLMVMGEYAVLEGSPAVVTAVDRRAVAWLAASPASSAPGLPPEVTVAWQLAEQTYGSLPASLEIDLAALRSSGRKLGLGSSAAGAAAAVGVALAAHGHDLASADIQQRMFELALRGHRAVAPSGSGADVAAAVWGGFLQFQLGDGGLPASGLPTVQPLAWPESLAVRVVWTGEEARTSDLVATVKRYAQHAPEAYRHHMSQLDALSRDFIHAVEIGAVSDIIGFLASYGEAMSALGKAAGAPIVTPQLTQVAHLAAQHRGAAKPSGAGGGDVAIALFLDDTAASKFEHACHGLRLSMLPIHMGAHGTALDSGK